MSPQAGQAAPAVRRLERQRYVTRKQHGTHPRGSECWASRSEDGVLVLEFEDGERLALDRKYYAEGLETGCPLCEDAAIFLAM